MSVSGFYKCSMLFNQFMAVQVIYRSHDFGYSYSVCRSYKCICPYFLTNDLSTISIWAYSCFYRQIHIKLSATFQNLEKKKTPHTSKDIADIENPASCLTYRFGWRNQKALKIYTNVDVINVNNFLNRKVILIVTSTSKQYMN